MSKARPHFAHYGNVKLIRDKCPSCEEMALIIDNEFACCGKPWQEVDINKKKQMSEAPPFRHSLPQRTKKYILEGQGNKCFWCERMFGVAVYRGTKRLRLRIHWDHMVPFVYSRNNTVSNYVAACHVCNGIKSSHIFNTIEEGRIYLAQRWKEKDYKDLL